MSTAGDRTAGRPPGTHQDHTPRTYYGQPVLQEPEWTWEVPWYLFVGGLGGAAAVVAEAAERRGDHRAAGRARALAAVSSVIGPALLVKDLGRPRRFLNMLRVFKPTSAMSVGSWVLALFGTSTGAATVLRLVGRLPRLRRLLDALSALLGLPMTTYTGVLVADSSIPVWHEARMELPFLFAASGATSAGAAVHALTPGGAEPARRLALGAAVVELATTELMERRLGDLGDVYERGDAGRWTKAAKVSTAAGAVLLAAGRRRRGASGAGSALVLLGSVCQRWAVYRAGFASASDPAYVVEPQRERLRGRRVDPVGRG